MSRTSQIGWWMLLVTAVLVTVACILYVAGRVGLAQFFLVMASGTAGAATVLFVERRR